MLIYHSWNEILKEHNLFHTMPTKTEPPFLKNYACFSTCLIMSSACTFAAEVPAGVIRPYAAYSVSYDDNLLRLHDSTVASVAHGSGELSDVVRRAEVRGDIEKKISQQTLSAAINFSRNTFTRFQELDHNGMSALVQWNWRLGNHLYGVVGGSRMKELTPFVEFHQAELNLRRRQREFADVYWRFHPSWRFQTSIEIYDVKYDLPSQSGSNRRDTLAELGIAYLPSTGSTAGIYFRHVNGTYPNREAVDSLLINNSYQQNELLAKVDSKISGKSRLQFQGGYVQRKHETFLNRDFNGFSARVIADWAATGKTNISLSAWRQIGAYEDLTTSYTINQGASVALAWDASAKVKIDGIFRLETRDFAGAERLSIESLPNRKDRMRYSTIGLTFLPTSKVKIRGAIFMDKNSSNIPMNGYRAKGGLLSMAYQF